jgi:hypothetical protein
MRLLPEQKKEQLLADLLAARRSVVKAVSSLSTDRQDEAFVGVWSVKDLLAHLVGWDYANMEAVQAIQAGRLLAFYEHYDRDWHSFNAHLVAEHGRRDVTELLDSLNESHSKLIELVRALPPTVLFEDKGLRFRGYKVIIGRILQVEAEDEKEHCGQILTFRDEQGP